MMTHVEWLTMEAIKQKFYWPLRTPTWWTCRCSACVLQRQEKDDQYRDHAANGQL